MEGVVEGFRPLAEVEPCARCSESYEAEGVRLRLTSDGRAGRAAVGPGAEARTLRKKNWGRRHQLVRGTSR